MAEQTTLTIGGKTIIARYPMGALQRVLKTMNVDSTQLAAKAASETLEDVLEFTLTVAWSGIVSAQKAEGVSLTWQTPADLGEEIESLNQLEPCIVAFTRAWRKFTGADDEPGEEQAQVVAELPAQ